MEGSTGQLLWQEVRESLEARAAQTAAPRPASGAVMQGSRFGSPAFAWGREGHQVVALIAEQNTSSVALEQAKALLGGASLEDVANWADNCGCDHPKPHRGIISTYHLRSLGSTWRGNARTAIA